VNFKEKKENTWWDRRQNAIFTPFVLVAVYNWLLGKPVNQEVKFGDWLGRVTLRGDYCDYLQLQWINLISSSLPRVWTSSVSSSSPNNSSDENDGGGCTIPREEEERPTAGQSRRQQPGNERTFIGGSETTSKSRSWVEGTKGASQGTLVEPKDWTSSTEYEDGIAALLARTPTPKEQDEDGGHSATWIYAST